VVEHREASIPLKQQAVLFRASHHSAQLEIELTRRNIRCGAHEPACYQSRIVKLFRKALMLTIRQRHGE
jgi:superfamily I DNA/RNA helicase